MMIDRCIHELPAGTCGLCAAKRNPVAPACRWCGRPLRDPVSQQLGTGPQCFVREKRLPAEIRKRIAEAKHGMVRYGPLPVNSANNWLTAFNNIDGVSAHLRSDGDEAWIYLVDSDDRRAQYGRWRR